MAVDPAEASVCHALLVGLFDDTYWIYDEWRHHHGNQGQLSHTTWRFKSGNGWKKEILACGRECVTLLRKPFGASSCGGRRFRSRRYKRAPARLCLMDEIRLTQAWLASGKLRLSLDVPETYAELCSYAWDEKAAEAGEDKPVKENDHSMDCMRYFTMTFARAPRHVRPTIRVR